MLNTPIHVFNGEQFLHLIFQIYLFIFVCFYNYSNSDKAICNITKFQEFLSGTQVLVDAVTTNEPIRSISISVE